MYIKRRLALIEKAKMKQIGDVQTSKIRLEALKKTIAEYKKVILVIQVIWYA